MEGRAEEDVADNRLPFLLAQRAASEGPRWTRAVKGKPVTRMSGYLPLWVEEESRKRKKVCTLNGRREECHNHPLSSIDMEKGRENSMTPNIRWKAVGFLLVSLGISITESWADSAEDRIRSHFNIPASVRLTEETIKQAVLRVLPVGSLAISIRPKLLDLGIGERGLSNYGESGKDNVAVIRIEYDPKTFDVVKRSYIISLYLTSEPIRTIRDITVKEWLTGP